MSYYLSNVLVFAAQFAMWAAAGALLARMLRGADPRARLWLWQMTLAGGLAAPFLGRWETPVEDAVSITVGMARAWNTPTAPVARPVPWVELLTGAMVLGTLFFLARLGLGMIRIGLYRRRSRAMGERWPEADFRISGEVTAPVTFGWWRPVVLLPEGFDLMEEDERRSVIAHELAHVRRGDWLYAVCEEVVRAVLWFHPAVWFVLHRIELEREQAVDMEAIRETGNREAYLQTLLAVAGLRPEAGFVPAPLFLRKRQLAHRVATILKEVNPMNLRKMAMTLAGSAAVLALAGMAISTVLPMKARAQESRAGAGVGKTKGGPRALHSPAAAYPPLARVKGIEGTVQMEVSIDARGLVSEAKVLSGPEELRRAAMQAVLQWQFETAGNATRAEVEMNFALVKDGGERQMLGVLRKVEFVHVPAELQARIAPRLPLKEGDVVYADQVKEIQREVAEVSPGFNVSMTEDQVLRISAMPMTIRVGGNVQSAKLVKKGKVVYPPEAKAARIQGTVRFSVTIAPDGKVSNIELVAGHPILVQAAMEGVRQWEYEPTLLNGKPVAVMTMVDVNFTLSDVPPAAPAAQN
ncbi:MAG: TonB family protein, partial [Bryobacterales bacterium]|nr:TonB family protein [Bryobacterales bacterium]